VVAVPVQERLPAQRRRLVAVQACEELAQVERLLRQPLGVLVEGQQLGQLVLEDGDATRLDPDHWHPGADLLAQVLDHPLRVAPGEMEHPVVVQRPSAAEVQLRNDDVEAGLLERLHRREPDLRLEVVRERVRPE
jgi:hypothetical protein